MNEAALLSLILAAYLFPALLAGVRGVPNAGSVTILNIFLGWTLLGWVVSLAMACRSRNAATTISSR